MRRESVAAVGALTAAIACAVMVRYSSGMLLWVLLGGVVTGLLWAVHYAGMAGQRATGKAWAHRSLIQNATVAVISTAVVLAVCEGVLASLEARNRQQQERDRPSSDSTTPFTPDQKVATLVRSLQDAGVRVPDDLVARAAERQSLLTMPSEWERVNVEMAGATSAYSWQGVLHVFDGNRMRRTTPFPPKQPGVFRVMVLGDSFTYGKGIAEDGTYASQLQRLLQTDYRIEVLNLGVGADQSEDILRTLRRFLPELHPDLVIYGVCHNDFLPSGVGGDSLNNAYAFPLSKSIKKALMKRSRFASLTSDAYNKALLRLGLRTDFYDQILKDFQGEQARFGRDVKEMNAFVTGQGLPPIVTIVFDRFPAHGSKGDQLTQVAERYLKAAGMDVIETTDYYDRFAGQNFSVSPWEAHPNEIANAIWSAMIAAYLKDHVRMEAFKKSG